MSKCRPDCCSGPSSSDGFTAVVLGLVVLVVAVYGIIRAIWHAICAIWHVVIQIIEITAITLGSIAAAVAVAAIVVRVIRWQHTTRKAMTGPKFVTLVPANLSASVASALRKPAHDPAELFAEAIANDMDPRFIERILNVALERHDQ